MKQFYSIIFLLLITLSAYPQSAEAGITPGELSVSLNGAANYSIPIAVPPGINGVVPKIELVYNSQTGNGSAGYGWNIAGISAVTMIQPTMFHDGVINSIDADPTTNRFALDGQRLLKKDGGNYFAIGGKPGAGNEYVLENYSNVKIISVNYTPSPYSTGAFKVYYPDGSFAYYQALPSTDGNNTYVITYWENAQGVRISYTYNTGYYKKTTIASIQYGSVTGNAPLNEIKFIYKARTRPEQGYINDLSLTDDTILSEINVVGNGVGYRNYILGHDQTLLGYDRLISLTEKSGDNTKSYNPTVFEYEKSTDAINAQPFDTGTVGVSNINSDNSSTISGDFDGDGKMDFVLYATKGDQANNKIWLFSNIKTGSLNMPKEQTLGVFETLFPSSFLYDSGKMSPAQGITAVQLTSLRTININTYANNTFGVGLIRTRAVTFPTRYKTICAFTTPINNGEATYAKTYYSGDFNGDGITDVIAIDKEVSSNTTQCQSGVQPKYFSTGKVYFIDLDSRKSTGYLTDAGNLSDYLKNDPSQMFSSSNDRIETFDVNGDGKTDILHFKNGSVTVYTLDSNNLLKLLFKFTDANILMTQTILPGDYNGDGKMDFIISKNTALTNSNDYFKFLSTGKTFEKTTHYYAFPNVGSSVISESGGGVSINNLIPLDYNGDGKTDMIHFRSIYGNTSKMGAIIIKSYNNTGASFTYAFEANIPATPNIKSYAAPIFLSPNKNNQYVGIGAISDNLIYTFNSLKDTGKETSLTTVTDGNFVKDKITYSRLEYDPYETIYTPAPLTENYPNVDIQNAPNVKVVKMLERTSSTDYKKQTFNYYGAVANNLGLGYLGFRATTRTNWYNDSSKIISYIDKNDINLRGANIENFSVTGLVGANYSPATYISKSVSMYNTAADALQSNKVFKLKNISVQEFNGLDDTSKETTLVRDQNNYVTKSTAVFKEAGTTVQTTVNEITYKDVSATPYFMGLPTTKKNSVTVNGVSSITEEEFTYTSTGLASEIKNKAANTNYVTQSNTFDSFGNLTKKIISAANLSPRETIYEFDVTGRFMIKNIDQDKLSTTFDYNPSSGVLNFDINPYGLKTTYDYDSWFKKTKITDYLGKSTNYTYVKSLNNTIITASGQDGATTVETVDDLGRKIISGIKNINGNFSNVRYIYDLNDRQIQVSEPYFGSSPSQWNISEYDIYGRLITSTFHTGNIISTSYSKLTTSITEGSKRKDIIKNALGQIVSLTETPGGTITYTYFPNGDLRTSTFNSAVTTIEQDAWGRKSKLTDPSAGTFLYEYNDFGELTKETTPNGVISYTFTPEGNLYQKTVSASNANSKTTYNYDSTTKLLLNKEFQDLSGVVTSINFNYTYDSSKRIRQVEEITPYASFKKTIDYDGFGRVEIITNDALISSKTSTTKVKRTYKNGFAWQIVDHLNPSVIYWQVNEINAAGDLLTARSGPFNISNEFDLKGFPSRIKYDMAENPAENILTLNTNFEPTRGNLKSRSNSLFGWNESFDYDALDRLTNYTNASGTQDTQSYDDKGRITQNTLGTYGYISDSSPYQNTSIGLNTASLDYYLSRPLLKVDYNAFKSPLLINESGIEKISFTYNDSNDRSTMFYGGTQDEKLDRPLRKHYSSDGTMEIKENRTTGKFEFITYIGGDAYSSAVVLRSDGMNQKDYLYLQRDYQGSVVSISNESGVVLEKRLFDAWGSIIKVMDGSGNVLSGLTILDRGYTGHEHLQSVGLINMNGRLYDPKLHRFLQPDNNIQDPFNVQNYNRFSYVLNNPLKFSDKSGEFWHIAVGAVIGGIVNWATHGFQFNAKGLAYFGVGAAAGALTAMGAGGVSSALAGGSFSAGALGTTAAMTVGSGFASGAVVGASGGLIGGFATGIGNSLVDGQNLRDSFKIGIRDGITGAITGGILGGVAGGLQAMKEGTNFWSGEGTEDMIANDLTLLDDGNGPVNYSNQSAKDFSNSHTELKRLSANVDHLYADGSVPNGYTYKDGLIYNSKNERVLGVTDRVGWFKKTNDVYLSARAFESRTQLYSTMHHEYMHAYFYAKGIPFSDITEHKIINKWTFDQSKAWNVKVNYDRNLIRGHDVFKYSQYGFKIINYLP
ncbi:FG-GAP-like repeat-containing protein [Flavobacterium bizetiae]|uniref:FG-GAP-like repeat-containing protein n=1 Tax=Flavobacterium bizetiae TaxID=2704140 RepID=UPI0037578031